MPSITSISAKLRFLFVCISLSLLISFNSLNAQILKDPSSLKLVKEAIDCIYNMKFSDAEIISSKISRIYPGHPVVLLLKSMIIYWDNYPLISTSPARTGFEDMLNNCIGICEKYEKENEAEFLLANLCARGMLLLYYSDNDLNSKVFSMAKNTYKYLRRSFDFINTFPDFNFFAGLYNYYREAYPDAHPIYKPLLFLFPAGDRNRGLNELTLAFENSIFLKSEASDFLSSNYKYFENDFVKASYFSKTLYNHYPPNIAYRAYCIEDLLLIRKYDEAERLITLPYPETKNAYFRSQLNIFRGILYEKKYHDMQKAEQAYTKGVEEISSFGDYGDQYAAYAYFGLSRISASKNERENQKNYRKKALELTPFKEVNFDQP
jgi:hypothetical protein